MVFYPFLVVLIGYLIGSINPAYILGRVLRGIDIREHGTKNAGTTNAKRVLGWGPAIICGTYDVLKGLFSMFIAWKFGVSEWIIYLAGFAAIVGHVFPFYLRFRGGQGVGTAVGLMLYALFTILTKNWLPYLDILILAIMTLSLLYITRQGEIIGMVVLPVLLYFIYRTYYFIPITIFLGILILYIFAINILNIGTEKLLKPSEKLRKKVKLWRLVMRPLAVIFPILYLFYLKEAILIFLGIVAGIFLIFDLTRLLHRGINFTLTRTITSVFKKSEERRLSSMSLFLIACWLVIFIFDRTIAITAVTFLIFGDAFAKFFGIQYGRTPILQRTLEGSLAYFASCLICGFILMGYLPGLSLVMVITGSLAATITEVLPFGIDDNFSVALISASTMFLIEKLL